MTDSIKKCEDCKYAVPVEDAPEWRGLLNVTTHVAVAKTTVAMWHLGAEDGEYSYCSGMRQGICRKDAKFFEPR